MERDSFVFYKDWAKLRETMKREDYNEFVATIIDYGLFGIKPKKPSPAFELIKMQIDRNLAKYDEICEKRREAINKRWKKVKADTNEYKCIQTHTSAYNPLHNDNDNVNDNVNDNDNVKSSTKADDLKVDVDKAKSAAEINQDYMQRYFAPNKRASLETLLMQLHRENKATATIDDFKALAKQVVDEWEQNEEPAQPNFTEWSKRLINTIRIKNRAQNEKPSSNRGGNSYADARQKGDEEFAKYISSNLRGAGLQ